MGAAGGAAGGAAAAGAVAAMINAVKASGVLVRVEPDQFDTLVNRTPDPLVVHATGGFFSQNHQYLTSYKGLAFFTKNAIPIRLPPAAEVVEAKSIWIPG